MNPRMKGQKTIDGETQFNIDDIRSFERTDITVVGWFHIHSVVFTAFWISGFERVQWRRSAIGAVVFLLLAAFVIRLSSLTIHTESGPEKFRGTTSRLHDISDALSARLSTEADRECKDEQCSGGNR